MKRVAYLSALNLYVPLNDNEHFYDDGEVDDLRLHATQLYKKYYEIYGDYRIVSGITPSEISKSTSGICLSFFIQMDDWQLKKYVHIFYRLKFPWTRAHEEAHALETLGKVKWLFVEIGRKYGKLEMIKTMMKYLMKRVSNPPSKIFQYDGYIGTAFALSERGMIVEGITKKPVRFTEALDIVESIHKKGG